MLSPFLPSPTTSPPDTPHDAGYAILFPNQKTAPELKLQELHEHAPTQ